MASADRDIAELQALQAALAEVLRAADPVAALDDHPTLGHAIDADGLRIAALLVAKLRFERLMQGSRRANKLWERDPRAFTQTFRAYHAEMAPRALDPREEATAFETWLDR